MTLATQVKDREREFHSLADPTAPIATVAIPTCDRLGTLLRCLSSYIQNCRKFGRKNDFFISDDSRLPATPSTNERKKEALTRVRKELGASVFYAGAAEKKSYASALSRAAGVPLEVVEFALGLSG